MPSAVYVQNEGAIHKDLWQHQGTSAERKLIEILQWCLIFIGSPLEWGNELLILFQLSFAVLQKHAKLVSCVFRSVEIQEHCLLQFASISDLGF